MFTITNGFTFIAFLMFVAGGLLALEKYAKLKIFNWVPPPGLHLRHPHDPVHHGRLCL